MAMQAVGSPSLRRAARAWAAVREGVTKRKSSMSRMASDGGGGFVLGRGPLATAGGRPS